MKGKGAVYLLHFKDQYQHTRHYVGYVYKKRGLKNRLTLHAKGWSKVKIMEALYRAGIPFYVALVAWDASKDLEKRIKNCHNHKKFCLICRGEVKLVNGAKIFKPSKPLRGIVLKEVLAEDVFG